MDDLTLEHAELSGTLILGTSRGDGTAEVVKPLGWRWGRSIGAWYLPRSRYQPPKRGLIEQAAAALREAGFDVVVSVDAAPADRGEVERQRSEHEQARAGRLEQRAGRHAAASDGAAAGSAAISEGIPTGQPILADHHSAGRHRRDLARIERLDRATIEHGQEAAQSRAAAAAAAAASAARHEPLTVARRVERQGVELRRLERSASDVLEVPVETLTGHQLERREQVEALRSELAYWTSVRAEQLRTGQSVGFGPGSVKTGDLVLIRNRWRKVVRANRASVSVETDYSWSDRCPWLEVTDHRPAAGT